MLHNIPCVILSGGKSSRMGEDKSLLPFENYPTLIEYQYNKLSKIFTNVYISSKNNKFDFIDKSHIILDENQNISSPMIALQSVFEYLKSEKVFIITVDVPFIHTQTIKRLITNSNNTDITIASDEERTHNLCGVFNKKTLPLIKELLLKDIHKINYLVKQTSKNQIINFTDKEQFLNLNTTEDYQKAINITITYSEH